MKAAAIVAAILAALLAISVGAQEFAAKRSASEVYRFRGAHPCPATGKARGACPGWEVDHIKALRCGGPDVAANMQWLTIEAHRAKSRREARTCPGGWRKAPRR